MGYIEDTRKVLQGFPTPELRAIVVRLDKLEELVNANERRAEQRFSEIERRAEQRHSETLNVIASLSNYQAVLERLARLESKQNVSAA